MWRSNEAAASCGFALVNEPSRFSDKGKERDDAWQDDSRQLCIGDARARRSPELYVRSCSPAPLRSRRCMSCRSWKRSRLPPSTTRLFGCAAPPRPILSPADCGARCSGTDRLGAAPRTRSAATIHAAGGPARSRAGRRGSAGSAPGAASLPCSGALGRAPRFLVGWTLGHAVASLASDADSGGRPNGPPLMAACASPRRPSCSPR